MRNNEIKKEIYEIKKWEDKIKQEDLKYKPKNYTYCSYMKRAFGDNIYNNKINID